MRRSRSFIPLCCGLVLCLSLAQIAYSVQAKTASLSVRNLLNYPIRVVATVGNESITLSDNLAVDDVSSSSSLGSVELGETLAVALEVTSLAGNATNVSTTLNTLEISGGVFRALVTLDDLAQLRWTVVSLEAGQPQTDHALILVASLANASSPVSLWAISSQCFTCDYQPLWSAVDNTSLVLNTDYPILYQLRSNDNHTLVSGEWSLVSAGIYSLLFTSSSLRLITESADPQAFWLPPVVALAILAGLAIIAILIFKVIARLSFIQDCISNKPQPLLSEDEIQALAAPSPSRVQALDAFRGFTMAWMVFVNYGAGSYWFFDHAPWNGLHVADLLFPWFIFIMGTAMALSYKFLDRATHVNRVDLVYKIVRRSVLLFVLGLFLNNMGVQNQRIMGVLQRFGLSYLIVGLILVLVPRIHRFMVPTNSENPPPTLHRIFADILPYLWQWAVVIVILIVYLLLQFLLPVPGCPTGYLGPGGLADGGKYFNCTGGAHGYIDRVVLTVNHMYLYPTCSEIYHTGAFDPEGLLGVLTSIFATFLGVQSGRILTAFAAPRERIVRWCAWFVFLGVITLGLTSASMNDGIIPINKNLWSPSFVTATACLGNLLLVLFYLIVDVAQVWSGAPFIFVGMNSILIYACHGILHKYFPFSFANDGSHAMILFSNLLGVASWLVVAYRMYQLKFFVKI